MRTEMTIRTARGVRARWVALLAVASLMVSCSSSSSLELVVDLETDLRPGTEFTAVGVTLYQDEEELEVEQLPVSRGDDFLSGRRVAEIVTRGPGSYRLVVELRDLDGELVAERAVRVRLEQTQRVRVLITRGCLDVECPGSGDDDAATECLAGHCVPPGCTDSTCTEAECGEDGECVAASPCAEGFCQRGFCLQRAYDERCPPRTYCAPGDGCISDSGPIVDAGMDAATDAGGTDAGGTDAGGTDAGPCAGECMAGETQSRGCGNCGTEERSCDDDCTWGDWSSCSGEGECARGSSSGCSGGFACSGCSSGCCETTCCRECNDSCSWEWVCDMACVNAAGTCTDVDGNPVCDGDTGLCQECPAMPGCYNLCTCNSGSWSVMPGCYC